MKYKYRTLDERSLAILTKKEIYFSGPKGLNDPCDCQLNIFDALQEAINIARKQFDHNSVKKLNKLVSTPNLCKQIETDVVSSGVFSLARRNDNMLMWTHYADNHHGFCIGFDFGDRIIRYNQPNLIVGSSSVKYFRDNPYIKFFRDFFKRSRGRSYQDFWQEAITIGLLSKSAVWKYEDEFRIIRKNAGLISFSCEEVREIIFGLRLDKAGESKIRSTLSGGTYTHVKFKRLVQRGAGFKFQVVDA
jgi:hypothetical protein